MQHFAKLAIGALLACAVVVMPLQAEAQTIQVDPTFVDFGITPIGGSSSQTITVTNTHGSESLTVSNIEFTFNQWDSFSWSAAIPALLLPGESMDVQVTFAAPDWSFYMADMWIHSNATNQPSVYVGMMGEGDWGDPCLPLANCGGVCTDTSNDVNNCGGCYLACSAPANASAYCEAGGCGFECDPGYELVGDECLEPAGGPLDMIADIIEFFDDSRADGTLVGLGPGRSGEHRADALGNMLDEAEALIAAGEWDAACGQVQAAYLRTDSAFPPPDFVDGENTYTLAEMLWLLGAEMDCPQTQVTCAAAPGTPGAPAVVLFALLGLALARIGRR